MGNNKSRRWVCNVYFINNIGRVFDKLEFKSVKIARRRLRKCGFDYSTNRYCKETPREPLYIQLSKGKKSAPYSRGNLFQSVQRERKNPCKYKKSYYKGLATLDKYSKKWEVAKYKYAGPPCPECGNDMFLDNNEEDLLHLLSEKETTERRLGTKKFKVYKCSNGHTILDVKVSEGSYKKCTHCGAIAGKLTKKLTVTPATYTHSGKRMDTYTCQHCGTVFTVEVILPRLEHRSSSSGGGGRSGGGGGGSYGGGRSGGGGAGGSW